MALGAFLAGLVVGRSDYSLRAASDALPMRDAFAVLFFVAVGMLLEPRYLIEAPGLIAATLAVVLVGKPLVGVPDRATAALSVSGRARRSRSPSRRSASSRSSWPTSAGIWAS